MADTSYFRVPGINDDNNEITDVALKLAKAQDKSGTVDQHSLDNVIEHVKEMANGAVEKDNDVVRINYNKLDKHIAKAVIGPELGKLASGDISEVSISHIVSSDFIKMFDVEDPDDFNGWQCDWWSTMYFNDVKLNVSGCAFYGTINISKEEVDDEDEDDKETTETHYKIPGYITEELTFE